MLAAAPYERGELTLSPGSQKTILRLGRALLRPELCSESRRRRRTRGTPRQGIGLVQFEALCGTDLDAIG